MNHTAAKALTHTSRTHFLITTHLYIQGHSDITNVLPQIPVDWPTHSNTGSFTRWGTHTLSQPRTGTLAPSHTTTHSYCCTFTHCHTHTLAQSHTNILTLLYIHSVAHTQLQTHAQLNTHTPGQSPTHMCTQPRTHARTQPHLHAHPECKPCHHSLPPRTFRSNSHEFDPTRRVQRQRHLHWKTFFNSITKNFI